MELCCVFINDENKSVDKEIERGGLWGKDRDEDGSQQRTWEEEERGEGVREGGGEVDGV